MELQKHKISNWVNKSKIIYIFILLALFISNLFFIGRYKSQEKKLEEIKKSLEIRQINEKALNFTKFFIEKVLKTESEVDFETRLKLENAVRDLNDQKILAQWQKFVDSKTENEAQQEVKNLLELLVNKIKS